MTLDPYLSAPAHIQVHIVAALLALLLGPVALYRVRRDGLHKAIGYAWITLMAVVALSSFLITNFGVIGPFSPIHLLAILTLWSLWAAVRHARAGRIAAHRIVLRNLYWYGLIIAGLFNFLPGRGTNRVVFAGREELGLWVIAAGMTLLLGHLLWQRGLPRRVA